MTDPQSSASSSSQQPRPTPEQLAQIRNILLRMGSDVGAEHAPQAPGRFGEISLGITLF